LWTIQIPPSSGGMSDIISKGSEGISAAAVARESGLFRYSGTSTFQAAVAHDEAYFILDCA